MIGLLNNLHYGKLNHDFPVGRLDAPDITAFKADKILVEALDQKNMMAAVLNVQPHSEAYANLQHHMQLLTTKCSGPDYVKPESDIRKMAINMERLRWINTTGRRIHLTCIVREGVIINYKDVYNQDKNLERILYNENRLLNHAEIINHELIMQ